MPPFSAHKRENGDIVARGSQVGVLIKVVHSTCIHKSDFRIPASYCLMEE